MPTGRTGCGSLTFLSRWHGLSSLWLTRAAVCVDSARVACVSSPLGLHLGWVAGVVTVLAPEVSRGCFPGDYCLFFLWAGQSLLAHALCFPSYRWSPVGATCHVPVALTSDVTLSTFPAYRPPHVLVREPSVQTLGPGFGGVVICWQSPGAGHAEPSHDAWAWHRALLSLAEEELRPRAFHWEQPHAFPVPGQSGNAKPLFTGH